MLHLVFSTKYNYEKHSVASQQTNGVRSIVSKGKGGRVPGRSGPWENWEEVQVLLISRGVEVVTRGLGPLGR